MTSLQHTGPSYPVLRSLIAVQQTAPFQNTSHCYRDVRMHRSRIFHACGVEHQKHSHQNHEMGSLWHISPDLLFRDSPKNHPRLWVLPPQSRDLLPFGPYISIFHRYSHPLAMDCWSELFMATAQSPKMVSGRVVETVKNSPSLPFTGYFTS